jgi:hypothetical protein
MVDRPKIRFAGISEMLATYPTNFPERMLIFWIRYCFNCYYAIKVVQLIMGFFMVLIPYGRQGAEVIMI